MILFADLVITDQNLVLLGLWSDYFIAELTLPYILWFYPDNTVTCLNIASEVAGQDRYLEAPAAGVAVKGLEAGVRPSMCDEVGGLAEPLAAHHTLVRLLAWKRDEEWPSRSSCRKATQVNGSQIWDQASRMISSFSGNSLFYILHIGAAWGNSQGFVKKFSWQFHRLVGRYYLMSQKGFGMQRSGVKMNQSSCSSDLIFVIH